MSVFYSEGAIFKVRIVDEHGNPVSGNLVTFKVNGITYSSVSNSNGYASCNINWNPGKSSISTVCGDLTASNSIRVKSVIHATKNVKVKKSKKYKASATYEDKLIYKNKALKVKIGGKKIQH